jgi:hypothetical protein
VFTACDASNPLAGLSNNDLPDDDDESGPIRKRQRLLTEGEEEREEKEATGSDTPDDSQGSDYQDMIEKKAQNIIQQVRSIFAAFQEVGANISPRSGPRLVSKI